MSAYIYYTVMGWKLYQMGLVASKIWWVGQIAISTATYLKPKISTSNLNDEKWVLIVKENGSNVDIDSSLSMI